MMKILLLEDDPVLSDLLLDFLREYYSVEHAYSSDEARDKIDASSYDLYVFDINVPGSSGLSLLEELRSVQDMTPVIMITAYQDIDHLRSGFDHGCNDYLRKPFDLEELLVRVENIQRQFLPQEKITLNGGYIFDPEQHAITFDGTAYSITPKESEILTYLIAHPNRLISTDELMQNLWSYDEIPSETTLRGYIKNVRDIIGKERIKTIRSQGYLYDAS